MNENEIQAARCANEACGRPAEPGEAYCDECGLERSLYFRDGREEANLRARAWREEPRR